MSARTNAEREAERLDSVPLDEVGRILAHGIPGVIYALLDVADAIREQTDALTCDENKRAILVERNQ